jgi:excisionase family DNA binding protein
MQAAEFVVSPEEFAPRADDEQNLQESIRKDLQAYLRVLPGGRESRTTTPKLVFEDGKQIELPANVLEALHFVVHHMSRGDAISLIPMTKMLTPNQAAEILNVSRPFLVKMLKEGAIPSTMVGTHHRLRTRDVLQYKQCRDQRMLDGLNELAREAQEAGNYFDE